MTKKTATERAASKECGIESHPADKLADPLSATLADQADQPPKKARLKHLGGSESDAFNIALAEATRQTAWITSDDDRKTSVTVVGLTLAAIAPADELEGMLAAQMIASHQAAMECFRRAMLSNQTVPGRDMNLNQATKASRTFTTLLDALNRHRSKGQQRVVVEHVHKHIHVHESGHPTDHPREGGDQVEKASLPHAQKAIAHALEPAMWSENPERELVPRAGDAEREVQNARRS